MKLRLLADRAFWVLLARLLARGSLVVASVILARRLSTGDFAAYSYFQLTIALLATYATLGMSVTASKFFAEEQVAQENTRPALGALWALSILTGAVFALLILLVPAGFVDAGLPVPRYLLAAGLFALALCVVPDGGILGLEKYRAAVVTEILSASTVISGAAFAAATAAPLVAMWSLVLAAVVRSVGNTLIVVRQIGWQKIARGLTVDRAALSHVLSFIGPMTCVSLLAVSGPWLIGRILLRSEDGAAHFALYAIGLQWFALALFVPGAISQVALPFFVRTQAGPKDDTASGATATRLMVRASFMAGGVVCVFAAILSPWLWRLYGIGYADGSWLIVAFLLAALPLAPANTLGNALLASNRQWTWLAVSTASFVTLLVSAMVAGRYGAAGGAAAHTIASIVMVSLAGMAARRNRLI